MPTMPRIYCTRYPQYSIHNRDIKYQFRDGILDTDEAGERFLRSRPEWGTLFTDAPPEDPPANPLLWRVDTPKPLPAVPYNPPRNPLDTPANRVLGWPHLTVPGSGYPRPAEARLGPPGHDHAVHRGHATPAVSGATFAVAASSRPGTGNGPPATVQRAQVHATQGTAEDRPRVPLRLLPPLDGAQPRQSAPPASLLRGCLPATSVPETPQAAREPGAVGIPPATRRGRPAVHIVAFGEGQ
jgi:hypothetical protein